MERVSVAEASRRLGRSPTQIRRLVKAGQLRAEIEKRPQGTRLWVWIEDATGTSHDATEDASTTNHQAADHAPEDATQDASLTRHLETENAWLRARLESAEQERAQLRELLAREQSTVVQLRQLLPGHAPQDAPETPPATRRTHPWWAFWRSTP